MQKTPKGWSALLGLAAALSSAVQALPAPRQIDVTLETESSVFTVLPNGNIVVVDKMFNTATATSAGAVWLYQADGTLISKLTGADVLMYIGENGITVLSDGNFVVKSPAFQLPSDPAGCNRGATTWVNATTGLSGTVSAANSLIGGSAMIGSAWKSPPCRATRMWFAEGSVVWVRSRPCGGGDRYRDGGQFLDRLKRGRCHWRGRHAAA
jgi:hypothetical protein